MSNIIKCFHCNWRGTKYHLLIGPNGVKCPECEKHIPQDADGWVSVENGQPEESGIYEIKTNQYEGIFEAPVSVTEQGVRMWVVPDSSIITHWREKKKA